jgi:hypothetical protein
MQTAAPHSIRRIRSEAGQGKAVQLAVGFPGLAQRPSQQLDNKK